MDEFKEHTHKLVQLVIRIKRRVVSSFKFRHFESRKQEETGEIVQDDNVKEIRSSKRKISSKRKLELIAKTSATAATHLAAGQISRVSGGSCSILVWNRSLVHHRGYLVVVYYSHLRLIK